MGSLKMTDERTAGMGRSSAWVEVEWEVEVEVEVEVEMRRCRVELLVRAIFKKGGAKL